MINESSPPKVIVIGGAPMVGKSTLARKLAARMEYACLPADDLGQAVRAVTTADSHPAFHYMDGVDYREYYIEKTYDELIVDAERYLQAIRPALAHIITTHACWGMPAVIEGWTLLPQYVRELTLPNLSLIWLVSDAALLEQRVRKAVDFYRGASDEDAMIRKFAARSRWVNERIHEEAIASGLPVMQVGADDTPEALYERCCRAIYRR